MASYAGKAATFRHRIAGFAASLRERLQTGPITFRKDYLRSIVESVEVGDTVIRLRGRNVQLVRQLTTGRPVAVRKVRFFGQAWRPLGDSNPCYRRERAMS